MRVLMTIGSPDQGHATIRDAPLPKVLESVFTAIGPEVVYVGMRGGLRTAIVRPAG